MGFSMGVLVLVIWTNHLIPREGVPDEKLAILRCADHLPLIEMRESLYTYLDTAR